MAEFDGIKLTGFKELDKVFRELPEKVQRKVLRKAVRAQAVRLRDDEKQNLHAMTKEDTGQLAGSLKVKAMSRFRKGFTRSSVIATHPDGRHAGPLEYGHRVVNKGGDTGKRAAPVPFKRAAFEDATRRGTGEFGMKAIAEIIAEAVKLGRSVPRPGGG